MQRSPIITPETTLAPPVAEHLVDFVVASLEDDKAEEIAVIDLRGRTSIADHMVIASGRSTRQVGSMADHLQEKLKRAGLSVSIEGMPQCDWVLVDAGDIIVHLFRPEIRTFYNLEKMWGAFDKAAALPSGERAKALAAGLMG
jgi:ribosome-associated protein